MTTRFIKAVTLIALAVFSTLALADPPARVGRVSLAQGQVSISSEVGDEASAALVNWPVTSHNQVTTGRDARTEIRIGSTSVRLDADSSMEVSELDDDSLRLHLNYGSVSVRILTADVLAGFELSTPNGTIRLQEPGRLRVDAERERGTTAVNVFDGVAVVEDRGSQLLVRAGKRAEIRDDDVRTGLAVRDSFDDWAQSRDQRDDRSVSARYVTSEMTGYEDLDQNGTWRDDAEYGPLWQPRVVAADWAPYRDGSWTWVAPWGWTWVDNAPWGYAPFHYGRWVLVNQRWCWAPGRNFGRPVWAPALVGWVGGGGWSLSFGSGGRHHARPAQGWYPLSPRDSFVPGYRLSHDHLQRINRDARPDGRDDRRGRDGHDGRREHHREGLTVVPQDQFGRHGTIAVRNAPRAVVPPLALQNAPAAAPAAPQGFGRDHDGRRDRFDRSDRGAPRIDRDDMQRNRPHRPELTGVPVQRGPAANPAQPVVSGQPQAPSPSPFSRRDGRPGFEDRGQRQQPAPVTVMPAPVVVAPPPNQAPAAARPPFGRREGRPDFEDRRQRYQPPQAPVAAPPAAVMPPAAAPTPQAVTPAPMAEQRGRQFRNDGERRMREPDAGQAMPPQPPRQFAPPPVFHQQSAPVAAPAPAPAPAPPVMRQPAPQAAQAAQQAAAPASAPASAPEHRHNPRRADGEKER
jgi:hypothetical protein